MPKPPTNWLAVVGTFLACATLAWQMTAAWFSLLERVHDLERAEQFQHGDIKPFLPKEAK